MRIFWNNSIFVRSTFAWFSSKDEVTNRLSASSNYGVSIAENFQPPENWVPGQTINKDVSAVNTGNVDAFVRTWLTGEMKVLKTTSLLDDDASAYVTKLADNYNPKTNETDDASLIELNLTGYTSKNNVNYYYKQLSVAQTENPQDDNEDNVTDGYTYNGKIGDKNGSATASLTDTLPNSASYSEVQSIQAGGQLVYAPSGAEYEYVTNQATELKVFINGTVGEKTVTVPRGYLVKVVKDTTGKVSGTVGADKSITLNQDGSANNAKAVRGSAAVPTVYVKAQETNDSNPFTPVYVDSETFAPISGGTYIFARNVDSDKGDVKVTSSTLDDYEFSGYYFDASDTDEDNPTTSTAGKGNYWALKNADTKGTNRSDYTLPKKYAAYINEDTNNPYYVGDTGADEDTSVLALTFDKSGALAGVALTDHLELYTAKYTVIDNNGLTWVYEDEKNDAGNLTGYATLSAIYNGGTDTSTGAGLNTAGATTRETQLKDDIVVDIRLANITKNNDTDKWRVIEDTGITGNGSTIPYYKYSDITEYGVYKDTTNEYTTLDANRLWTFYYTNDVEAGDTTTKLVDSVTLRETTQKEAFIAFDFDLSVNLESVQVTFDELGNEQTTPIEGTSAADAGIWATATKDENDNSVNTGAYATHQNDTAPGEIDKITWTAVPTT